MAKEREGNFHTKGVAPSERGVTMDVTIDHNNLEKQIEIEDRYGIDPDTNNIMSAQVRHPNRNPEKRNVKRKSAVKSTTIRNLQQSSGSSDSVPQSVAEISRDFIMELFEHQSVPCISIYISTEQMSVDMNEQSNAIAFKAALQQADKANEQHDKALLQRVLAPGYELLRNGDFWRSHTAKGLAFFLADGYFKHVALPSAPQTQTIVNSSFVISPLLPFIFDDEHYYLLVMSKKQSKLFRGNRFGLTFIPLEEMPLGIEDVVHLEEKDDENLFRTGSSGGGGGAVYHGTGSSRPDDKENIAMYLAEVDSTIRKEVLHDSTAPLLLAGVGYLIPIYKKVTKYTHVWDKSITGNHEYENEAKLFTAASEMMQGFFEEARKKALADYGNKSATGLTAHIIDDIVRAAYYRRIDTLFVSRNARLWGSFDDINDTLIVHASEGPNDHDLIDRTILKTVLSGGKVFMLDENEMPMRRMMLATMRYSQ
ncbi:MAG: hypothetical protein QM762_04020 [Chryseolinea sp.]